jgi:hypothetical protein
MDGATIDQLNEALAEVGGIDGFNAVWDKAWEDAGRKTDELWALTEGGPNSEDLTEAESLIVWDGNLTHKQKVRKLRALKRARVRTGRS